MYAKHFMFLCLGGHIQCKEIVLFSPGRERFWEKEILFKQNKVGDLYHFVGMFSHIKKALNNVGGGSMS